MDRIGDQSFYTLSMRYKKMLMGNEKISLSISKKYYLKDRKIIIPSIINSNANMDSMSSMRMNEEPLIMSGVWMPTIKTMVMGYGGHFKDDKKVSIAGLTINHKLDSGSFGYAKRYRRMAGVFNNQMNYSEIFADIAISPSFKLIAKLKRDDENNQNISSIIGIEYENCCLALRITSTDKNLSRYLLNQEILFPHLGGAWDNMIEIESKSRINFEFELKGLNSSFDKVNKLMNNSLFN
jgi:hypothetical protein